MQSCDNMNLSFVQKLCKVLAMLTSSFFHLHLNNLPFTNCDCMLAFAISLQHILHFLHWSLLCFTLKPFLSFSPPIVSVCQPSQYHCTYCISSISLNYVFYLETFPLPVVIACQPFCIMAHTTFPSLVLIVYYLDVFASLRQS